MATILQSGPSNQLAWNQPGHGNIIGPKWLTTTVLIARRRELPLAVIFVSLVWLVASLMHVYRNCAGKRIPHKPSGSLVFESLNHVLRGVTLALFVVASSRSSRMLPGAIASGYIFLLGLLRILTRGDNRKVLLHQVNAVAVSILAIVAASEALPLIVVGATYRPGTMTTAALVSLLVTNCLAALTPREWMHPAEDLDLPDGVKVCPTKEETCSWFDYFFSFSRVDFLLRKGWQNSITMKELEEIPWSYIPEVLRRRFAKLRAVHTYTGTTLSVMFWPQIIYCTILATLFSASMLFAPFSLFQLLEYLRAPEDAVFQPYVWLIVMFGGRMLQSMFQVAFAFTSRKLAIYVKMMLTGEVYQIALRSRELQGNFLKDPKAEDESGEDAEDTSSTGMLENLISSDIDTIMEFRILAFAAAGLPTCVIALLGLHTIIGWPAYVGLGLMLTGAPISAVLVSFSTKYEEKLKAAQDFRISLSSEYLRSIKVIKYFGWESSVAEKLKTARAGELKHLWTIDMFFFGAMELAFLLPILAMLLVFGLYVGVEKRELTASVAYTTIILLSMVRDKLGMFAGVVMQLPRLLVSLQRFNRFFAAATDIETYPQGNVRLEKATFRRSPTADFRLNDISIDFVHNGLNTVTGISGSGKTTLLLALLGETVKEAGSVTRQQDVGFASQSSWLQALTIRENILFNSPMNEERYRRVVEACCLDVDFNELPKGDETKIGENGTSLSGGQRARVALARAMYADASLLLLDDIFSALDTKTATSLWNHAFCSDLLKNRTIILVTQFGWVVDEADLAITMEDGTVKSIEQNLGHVRHPKVIESLGDETEVESREENGKKVDGAETPTASKDDDLTDIDQEIAVTGILGGFSFFQYMKYFGSPLIAVLTGSLVVISSAGEVMTNFWMSRWVDSIEQDGRDSTFYYLWIYIGISFAAEGFDAVAIFGFIRGSWNAGKALHDELIAAVMNVSLDWFRVNPVGRVVNRLSGDISTIDNDLVNSVLGVLKAIVRCLFMFGSVSAVLPIFFLPVVVLTVLGGMIANVYNRTSLIVKQLVSASQSPVLSDFSEGLGGMMVIRAMKSMPGVFSNKMNRVLYTSAKANAAQLDVEQWLKFRMNTLAALINVLAAILALVQRNKISAGLAGFCLSQASEMSDAVLYLIFDISELNIEMQTFHRLREYGSLPPEEAPADEKSDGHETYSDNVERSIPPNWPSSGCVEFRNVTIRYSDDGPDILKNINIKFNAGERVAIVGRTGSGKSTLVLSMLRFTNIVSGQILYDGVDITAIPRKQLRQAISTIPQEAQLFQGTLASNLDPTGLIPEDQLQRALDICQTMAAMRPTETPSGSDAGDDSSNSGNVNERLTLTSTVKAKGENFSHGQRQVLSLCRILVRRSKLMLLDEATSSMDKETDDGIQQALREEFGDAEGKSRCLITIAHRLQSIIDYDRVVVMGSGEILEEGSPDALMKQKGHFYDMWLHSNEKEAPSGSDV